MRYHDMSATAMMIDPSLARPVSDRFSSNTLIGGATVSCIRYHNAQAYHPHVLINSQPL